MTLIQALDRIHALLEGDTQTPTAGDDYDLRVSLINDAVEEWAEQSDVHWRELYETDTSNTGDGTTTSFPLPADFMSLNGNIILYDVVHDAFTPITPTSVARSSAYVSNGNMTCWIQGSNLVFNVAPDDDTQIHINYYKRPEPLTDDSDVLPMSRPRYAIHYVVSRLVEQSGDFTRYNTNMQKAEELMSQMKIDNETLGEGVPNQIQSLSAGFGI